MKQTYGSEDLIERYLLGELSGAEQAALENEYFVSQAKYDQLCKAEDDLLDRYARGALSPADRERIERQYLTNPWRRRHVEFAKALARAIDGELAARSAAKQTATVSWRSQFVGLPRGLRLALGLMPAIVALLIIGGTWFAIETSRLRSRLGEAQREVEAQRSRAQAQARQLAGFDAQHKQLTEERERLQAQLQAVKGMEPSFSRVAPATVFFTLSVEAFRSSSAQGAQALTIPRGVVDVHLRLSLPENEFPAYRLTLLTAEGIEVFSKNGLRPRAGKAGDFVIASLPASKFTSGDNVLALSGISSAGAVEPLGKSMIKVSRQ